MSHFKILVTGATGFIGKHLVARLIEKGLHVHALARSSDSTFELPGLSWRLADLRDRDSLIHATRGISMIYHTAAQTRGTASSAEFWKTNVDGARNFVEACIQNHVRKVVFLSSVSAYRTPLAAIIKEDAPLGGLDNYGQSKTEGEAIFTTAALQGHFESIIIRPCQVYGPGDRNGITNFIRRVLNLPIIPVVADDHTSFNLVYLDDVVDAVISAGTQEIACGQAYNIGAERNTSLRELVQIRNTLDGRRAYAAAVPRVVFRAAFGLRWLLAGVKDQGLRPRFRSYAREELHGSVILGGPIYDIDKARQDLGYKPRIDITSGAERVLRARND